MGQLSIDIGPVTSTFDFSNTSGQEVIENYLKDYGLYDAGDTNQEALDKFVQKLVNVVKAQSDGYAKRVAAEAAKQSEVPPEWGDPA